RGGRGAVGPASGGAAAAGVATRVAVSVRSMRGSVGPRAEDASEGHGAGSTHVSGGGSEPPAALAGLCGRHSRARARHSRPTGAYPADGCALLLTGPSAASRRKA